MGASKQPVLCYVDGPHAFFTTQSLKKQWGDDWNDAPYEHNAGDPYRPQCFIYTDGKGMVKRPEDFFPNGMPRWRIEILMWSGPMTEPKDGHLNSPWSVERINEGATPWLKPETWSAVPTATPIYAGTSVKEFIRLMRLNGGNAYVEAPK